MIENAFMVWLKSLESQMLVLHDELSLEGSSSLSTLSYLCALITEMMSTPGMFPLSFFCGLHSAEGDSLGGGYGLVRSLALQLLQQFGNTNLATTGDLNLLAQGLMINDLSTARSVFNLLLQSIPAGVVYIMSGSLRDISLHFAAHCSSVNRSVAKSPSYVDYDFKASLDFKNSTKRDIVEKTLKVAKEKKQICLKRRWKFKVNGKEVIVRDVVEKLIRWLDHFKAIGDIAVQHDQAHAPLPWAGTDEDQQLQQIASQDAKICTMAILSDAETLNLIRDLEQPIHRVADQAAKYAETLEDARYREILDWLSPIKYIEHQKRHSGCRLQGSGEWLLNSHEYLNWQSSSASSIFLLHGMAGTGKTFLASAIVDSVLRQSSNQGSSALLAYLYCSKSASEVELSDPEEIMRSIVRQLGVICGAKRTIHRAILNDYVRRETEAKLAGFDVARTNPNLLDKGLIQV
ncbi:MAG: hypothetical protein Q9207_003506 [Kuettlingeria erythrocarpa]